MNESSKPIPRHVPEFLDWLDIERGLSSRTQENYSRFLKKFLDWLSASHLESLKPHELSPQHVWKYRIFLSRHYAPRYKATLKKSSQNYYLIALRVLLSYFAARDISSLPPEKVPLAKDKEERQIRFLDWDQLQKLFSIPDTKTPAGIRDRTILEILFSTGMRVSELISLNRSQMRIRPETKDLEISVSGKGGRVRTVYISERSIHWLKKYLETRQDGDPAIFINYRARTDSPRRLTVRSVEKMVKKYTLLAGLPGSTTPHVMRHSFATDLLSQGVDLRTIQEFLGHRSIAATQIYAHVTSKKLRDVHRKFHSGRGKISDK